MEDEIIIQRIVDGNIDEYSIIVDRYQRLVKLIISKYISNRDIIDDIAQEIFTKVYFKLDTYNREYKFTTWLSRIVVNHCIDYKRKNRMKFVSIDETVEIRDKKKTPEEVIEQAEMTLFINEKIDELDDKYKEPLLLYHKNSLSYQEIADKLNQPMSIIKNRIYRARKTLKEKLQLYKERGDL